MVRGPLWKNLNQNTKVNWGCRRVKFQKSTKISDDCSNVLQASIRPRVVIGTSWMWWISDFCYLAESLAHVCSWSFWLFFILSNFMLYEVVELISWIKWVWYGNVLDFTTKKMIVWSCDYSYMFLLSSTCLPPHTCYAFFKRTKCSDYEFATFLEDWASSFASSKEKL